MTVPFHETRMGHRFLQRDVPNLISAVQEIAEQLKQLNAHLAREEGHDDPQKR